MLNVVFSFAFFVCATGLLVLSARSDWKGMTIPNSYAIGLVGLFLIGVVMPHDVFNGIQLIPGLAGGVLVFVVTLILYAGNAMGGGDTKMAGATALLVGIGYIGIFLLVMALTGGALAVYALLTRKHGEKLLPASPVPGTWLAQLKEGQNKVPYGLAIAAGGIFALAGKWVLPFLS